MIYNNFPHYSQIEQTDCGATCLKIILKYYGKLCDLSYLRELTQVTRTGVTLGDINSAAKKLRFTTNPIRANIEGLKNDVYLPCVLHWEQDHFVVLYKIKNNRFYVSDPGFGKLKLKEEEFNKLWTNCNEDGGIAIELKPDKDFKDLELPVEKTHYKDLKVFLKSILRNQGSKIGWLFFLIALSTAISYVFPKTIQELIDRSFASKNINVLWTIFGFQLALFFGQTLVNLIQNFIGVHFSTQVSIKILSNLLHKIVRLPIYFFENRLYSDMLQKIEEQSKIEQLLTKQLISVIFSVFLFIALTFRLLVYDVYLGLGCILLIVFSVFWMFVFYNKRKAIDYYSFKLTSENRNHLIEMITGMVSMKISNAHFFKINKWEELQEKIYSLKVRSLILDSYQSYAMSFFKQLFSLSITFICSFWVMRHKISVGEMLSIGYIVGMIAYPLENIILFIRSFQDSKMVYHRAQEIHKNEDENVNLTEGNTGLIQGDLVIDRLNFKYEGGNQPYVLKNICVRIPNGKVTAIVGESGSGKTTLLKILLGFYRIAEGEIQIGNSDLMRFNHDWWREQCGVVMQDGYIFSGTIGDNIVMKGEDWDYDRLIEACRVACIYDFVVGLPLGFKTKIGNAGNDLSGGQKQRILIARAVYSNPHFFFFDEATSSLDAKNELAIMRNLQHVFKGKTVLVIAHRLSTVKNADQIIVLKNGTVTEIGSHQELVYNKANYFNLVKNQLELGN